jgi:hypothetical protein
MGEEVSGRNLEGFHAMKKTYFSENAKSPEELALPWGTKVCPTESCKSNLFFRKMGRDKVFQKSADGAKYYTASCEKCCVQYWIEADVHLPRQDLRNLAISKDAIRSPEGLIIMTDELKIANLTYLVRRLASRLKQCSIRDDELIHSSITFVKDHIGLTDPLRSINEKQARDSDGELPRLPEEVPD